MSKLKTIIGVTITLCAITVAASPANAIFEGKSKGNVKGGAFSATLAPGGAQYKCKTISGTYDIKSKSPQTQSTIGPHLGLTLNLEGKPHSKTTTGKCEVEPVAGTFFQVQYNNPVNLQIIQVNKGEGTNLPINLEKTLKVVVDAAACEIVQNPGPNQERTKLTVANNGTNLKIAPEVKGITSEAIGAGCSVGGIKGGKEGSIALNTGEVLEAEGVKEI